jgi:hypothetical protein
MSSPKVVAPLLGERDCLVVITSPAYLNLAQQPSMNTFLQDFLLWKEHCCDYETVSLRQELCVNLADDFEGLNC